MTNFEMIKSMSMDEFMKYFSVCQFIKPFVCCSNRSSCIKCQKDWLTKEYKKEDN